MAHCVVRIYTDSGPLLETGRQREADIRHIMTSVPGFRMFGLSGTDSGGVVTITICDDKTGTDASIARAAAFIKETLPDAKIDPPRIVSGKIIYRLSSGRALPARPSGAHLRMRLFHGAPPAGFGDHADDIQKALGAVPGWLGYTAFADEKTGNGVIITSADDAASYDKIAQAHQAWVQATWPGLQVQPPEVIQSTGVYRFDAAPQPAAA